MPPNRKLLDHKETNGAPSLGTLHGWPHDLHVFPFHLPSHHLPHLVAQSQEKPHKTPIALTSSPSTSLLTTSPSRCCAPFPLVLLPFPSFFRKSIFPRLKIQISSFNFIRRMFSLAQCVRVCMCFQWQDDFHGRMFPWARCFMRPMF